MKPRRSRITRPVPRGFLDYDTISVPAKEGIQEESTKPSSDRTEAGPDYFFEVEMISVEDADLELGEE